VGASVSLSIDRSSPRPLSEQIRIGIGSAIRQGQLRPGARLPSWRDLATQLGVARGTVRVAYQRLVDEQLIVALGPAGTFVDDRLPFPPHTPSVRRTTRDIAPGVSTHLGTAPLPFQVGVPAQDAFPVAIWKRIAARTARETAARGVFQTDPRGEPELRQEISANLAVSRGLRSDPEQIFVTAGYSGGLGLALRALPLKNSVAWMEEPGYPFNGQALRLSGLTPLAIRVDHNGLVVREAIGRARNAALAVVTPGQQSPLGMPLSLDRRGELLDWAATTQAWIIEDDYLSELQLSGRAAPALASLDSHERVIHIGSFSKTVNPALRLGFVVVPPSLSQRFDDLADTTPAAGISTQLAVAEFLRGGHFLRHLRRMKRLYTQRLEAAKHQLEQHFTVQILAGPTLALHFPDTIDDTAVAVRAREAGLAPTPLSPWYQHDDNRRSGLLLGIATLTNDTLTQHCQQLTHIIDEHLRDTTEL
jgi:GntR family transcriptional regulator/MocR family aminotransferase